MVNIYILTSDQKVYAKLKKGLHQTSYMDISSYYLDSIDKFQCSYCKAFFFSKLNLERHSHLKHGKEPDAGKKFCKKCSAPFSNQHKCQKENGEKIVILVKIAM